MSVSSPISQTANLLRWVAVLPVFLAAATVVGSLVILLLYTVASLSLITWFLPDAREYLSFWQGNDMGGNFLDGTAWLFFTYSVAFSAALALALRIAPSHRVATGWILTGVVLLVLLGSLALTLLQQEPHTFSFWYRSLVELLSIVVGCGFGIWQAREDARA